MFEFLNQDPLITLAIGVVIVFILMFIFVSPKKKKSKKTDKVAEKTSEKKTETTVKSDDKSQKQAPEASDVGQVTKSDDLVNETNDDKQVAGEEKIYVAKKVKRSKSKPEVRPVFEKKEKKVQEVQRQEEGLSDDILSRAQFVNSSKKISKFAGFSNDAQQEIPDVEQMIESDELKPQDDCEVCQDLVKHFDHSRRLSKIIKDDSFDNMFMSHLTDHYLKIDADRHLKDVDKDLFERATKTLSKANEKLSDDLTAENRNDPEFMKNWLEDRKRENLANIISSNDSDDKVEVDADKLSDDLNLSAKNLLVSSIVMERKYKKDGKK